MTLKKGSGAVMDDAERERLRATLINGLNLSMQGSLGRRAPAPAAIPSLTEARSGLEEYTCRYPDDPAGWRLLSQAQEALMDYRRAIQSLERALRNSPDRSKRDLKKLAALRESFGEWSDLHLTPEDVAELGQYLREKLGPGTGDRELTWTRAWLEGRFDDPEPALEGLERRGAYSDWQVLNNIVRG